MKEKESQTLKSVRGARNTVHDMFNKELHPVKKYMNNYPLLTLLLPFFIGFIVGALVTGTISRYLILCMTGFVLPLPVGLNMGIPSYVTIAISIPLQIFIIYAAVTLLQSIRDYPRAEPYLKKMEKKFEPITKVIAGQGGIGLTGSMALFTFILGWMPIIAIAFFLNLPIATTMKAAIIGIGIAGVVYLAIFEGLLSFVPYPFLIIAIMMILFTIIGMVVQKVLARRSK